MSGEYVDFYKTNSELGAHSPRRQIRDVASIAKGHPVMDRSFFLVESIEPMPVLQPSLKLFPHNLLGQLMETWDSSQDLVKAWFPACLVLSTDQKSPHASLRWPFHPQPAVGSEEQQGFSG